MTESFKLTVQAGIIENLSRNCNYDMNCKKTVEFLLFLKNIHDYENMKIEL